MTNNSESEELKEKLYAAEQAFERRLRIMEIKLSQDLIKERALREAADKNLNQERELRQKQMVAAVEEKNAAIATAVKELEKQLEKANTLNITQSKQIETMQAAWKAEKEALEAEADQEVQTARTEADTLLTAERATAQSLRGEAAVLKQRYEDQLHAAKFAESNAQKLTQESKKLRIEVDGLVKDLAGVKSELTARESALEQKESTIREITGRERALEIQCAALKDAREVADKEAAEKTTTANNLTRQIESLRGEYRTAQKALKTAELAASSRKQRELAARKESKAQREIAERLRRQIKEICGAIAEAGALIQQPTELKNAVVHMYQTYAADVHLEDQENACTGAGLGVEEGVATEKRNHQLVVESLKATIQRLQRQLQDQRESNIADSRRAVSENSFLMKEIESLEQKIESYEKQMMAAATNGGGSSSRVIAS